MSRIRTKAIGFTLVEMLLVVVVIGIMAVMAVIVIGGNEGRNLTNEARRLHLLLTMAADEAIFLGEEFGFFYDEETNKYHLRYADRESREWLNFNSGDPKFSGSSYEAFDDYQLPPYIAVQIETDDEFIGLKEIADAIDAELKADQEEDYEYTIEEEDQAAVPAVELNSSGEVTPFKITLTLTPRELGGLTYILESDGISLINMDMQNRDDT